MIRIGYFVHQVGSGEVVVRLTTSKLPRIGSLVVNSGGKVIGRIIDIIGPVREPYAVIKPTSELSLKDSEPIFIKPRAGKVRRR